MPAHDVHSLRKKVTARDKAMAVTRPIQEAVKYIRERYNTDTDSATHFVHYLRGLSLGGDGPSKSNPVEIRHTRFDPQLGEWVEVPPADETKK